MIALHCNKKRELSFGIIASEKLFKRKRKSNSRERERIRFDNQWDEKAPKKKCRDRGQAKKARKTPNLKGKKKC